MARHDVLARLRDREACLELMRQRQAKEDRELFEKPGLLKHHQRRRTWR